MSLKKAEQEAKKQDDGRVLCVLVMSDGKVLVQRNTYPYRVQRDVIDNLDQLIVGLEEVEPTAKKESSTGIRVVREFHNPNYA